MTALEQRFVPGLGRGVSALGAGCWTIGGPATDRGKPVGWDGADDRAALAGLSRARELGVTLFDTADVYGNGRSERLVGLMLRESAREQVIVSSKVGYFAGAARHPYVPQQMSRQLETTLANLGTGYLDLYHFHSADFGPGDRYLAGAVRQMQEFRADGLVRAVGMRAPHTFAVEWAARPGHPLRAEAARFLHLLDVIRPDVVCARYSLLSPPCAPGETDVFACARARGVGVIIKQALGMGLLLGTHPPGQPRPYGPGDHRSDDPMFSPAALSAVHDFLCPIRDRFGGTVPRLAWVALSYALARDPAAPVLVGFRNADQIGTSVMCLANPLTDAETDWLRDALADLRAKVQTATPSPRPAPSARPKLTGLDCPPHPRGET